MLLFFLSIAILNESILAWNVSAVEGFTSANLQADGIAGEWSLVAACQMLTFALEGHGADGPFTVSTFANGYEPSYASNVAGPNVAFQFVYPVGAARTFSDSDSTICSASDSGANTRVATQLMVTIDDGVTYYTSRYFDVVLNSSTNVKPSHLLPIPPIPS